MMFSSPCRSMNGSYRIYRIKGVVVTLILIGKLCSQSYVGSFGKTEILLFFLTIIVVLKHFWI